MYTIIVDLFTGALMDKPLADILVLDFTHMLSGPYGTMLLADLGAETIKIEPVGLGESTRRLLANDPAHSIDGMGAYFLTLGRNKKSVCVDLKSDKAQPILHRLVSQADIVVDNFAPGVPRRLRIDHATLAELNPRIITCSITGFGETGPNPDRPAFDMVAQALSGGMSITGEENGRAIRAGIPIGDLGGGIFASLGILAALHARDKTGRGQHVDISMLDVQISMLNYMATMYFLSGQQPGPMGNGHFVHVPYDSFRTQSRDLIVAVLTDVKWAVLIEKLGAPELRKEEFKTQAGRYAGRQFINAKIQEILAANTCEHWLEFLGQVRIPCAPVNDFEHALNDPQVRSRDMVVSVNHPSGRTVQMPGNPIKLSEMNGQTFSSPPLLGQHTDEILIGRLGFSIAEVADLRQAGVIG